MSLEINNLCEICGNKIPIFSSSVSHNMDMFYQSFSQAINSSTDRKASAKMVSVYCTNDPGQGIFGQIEDKHTLNNTGINTVLARLTSDYWNKYGVIFRDSSGGCQKKIEFTIYQNSEQIKNDIPHMKDSESKIESIVREILTNSQKIDLDEHKYLFQGIKGGFCLPEEWLIVFQLKEQLPPNYKIFMIGHAFYLEHLK